MHNTWLAALVAKHARKGVLVDANLLVVYCVGSCSTDYISQSKPTKQYSIADFLLVKDLISRFNVILTTPNILTEVSNLLSRGREDIRQEVHEHLGQQITTVLKEEYLPTQAACNSTIFNRLGVSDAVIAILAQEDLLILTNDLDLKIHLEYQGKDVIHYDSMLRPLTFREGNTT